MRCRPRVLALAVVLSGTAVAGVGVGPATATDPNGFERAEVSEAAGLLDPVVSAAGERALLTGASSDTASPPVLVRTGDGAWVAVTGPGSAAPRRPAAAAAVAATATSLWRLDAGAGLAALTRWSADGGTEQEYDPAVQSPVSAAACGAAGAQTVGIAAVAAAQVLAIGTLPRADDPTRGGVLAVGSRSAAGEPFAWRCVPGGISAPGAPAIDAWTGRFAVASVRVVRGQSRLILTTGAVDDPAATPLGTTELGPVAGTLLACQSTGNLGAVGWDGDGVRHAAAVAQGGRSVHVWVGDNPGPVTTTASGPITAMTLAADPRGGAAVVTLSAANAQSCDQRRLEVARIDPDASSVSEPVTAATDLDAGCSSRLGAAVVPASARLVVAVQTGAPAGCAPGASRAGRALTVFTERAQHAASPGARSAVARSRASSRSRHAR